MAEYHLLTTWRIAAPLDEVYAAILDSPRWPEWWLRTVPMLFAGAMYGLAIYGINLYGLTVFFPWFAVARDWVTLVTHLVFGVALAEGCRLFAQGAKGAKQEAERRFVLHR